MERLSYTDTKENESTITNTKYDVQVDGVKYTVIGENIKSDFDFLIKDIPNLLEEAKKKFDEATSTSTAFYFENNYKIDGFLAKECLSIRDDINKAIEQLNTLHKALITDIDNINAELEYNFGDIELVNYEEAGREVIEKDKQE